MKKILLSVKSLNIDAIELTYGNIECTKNQTEFEENVRENKCFDNIRSRECNKYVRIEFLRLIQLLTSSNS